MATKVSHLDVQRAFAAHIRHPVRHPRPKDVEFRRMKIYVDLFYNNVESFLSRSFPILREIHSDEAWHHMARDFLHRHVSTSPYFLEIAQEFIQYLQMERKSENDLPFMLELAHYEWVELALGIATDVFAPIKEIPPQLLLDQHPLISSLAWPLAYQFPVHQIGPAYLPELPPEQPTYLIAYRNREDEIHFMEINSITSRLLNLLSEHPKMTGQEALQQIAMELQHPDPEVVITGGQQTLMQLVSLDIIVGTQSADENIVDLIE